VGFQVVLILLADRQQEGVSVPVVRLRHLWFLLLRGGFDSDVRSCWREGSRIEIPVAPRGLSGKKETAQRERPGAAGFAEPVVLEKTRLKVVGFGDFFLGFEVTSRICGGRSESGGGGRD
jgi:hypothetical protein